MLRRVAALGTCAALAAPSGCGKTQEVVSVTTIGTQATPTNVDLDSADNSTSLSLVIDAAGTKHLLYLATGPAPAYAAGPRYGECAGSCDDLTSWRFAALPASRPGVVLSRVVVDSQGRPRFTMGESSSTSEGGDVLYASCDEACTSATSWAVASIGEASESLAAPIALDDADGVHVVFGSGSQEVTAMTCATGCSEPSRWTSRSYAAAGMFSPGDLAVDSAGTLHMTSLLHAGSGYAEVPPGSTSLHVAQGPGDADLYVRMRLDSLGRPRLLLASSDHRTLGYASCDQGCASGDAWTTASFSVPGDTVDALDLALDANGAPHVLWRSPSASVPSTSEELGDATCDADCATTGSAWQTQVLASVSALESATPPQTTSPGGPAGDLIRAAAIALDASGMPSSASILWRADANPNLCLQNHCPTVLRYSGP